MEKEVDSVTISLKLYNDLYDFRNKIMDGKFYGGNVTGKYDKYQYFAFKTNDEVILDLIQKNDNKIAEIDKLTNRLNEIERVNRVAISDNNIANNQIFANMSIWRFLSFRKDWKRRNK